MEIHHVAIGLALAAVTILVLARRYFSSAPGRLPTRGWAGLAILCIGALLLAERRPEWLATYFTPLAWTGYILLADGLVESLSGRARLIRAPIETAAMALASIPLWSFFELYNLRLKNWIYVGLPGTILLDALGFGWAFATIWPAIFETADLLEALGCFKSAYQPRPAGRAASRRVLILVGTAMVVVPVMVPPGVGSYLFGAVWVGYVLLLDPILYEWGAPSLLREFEAGDRTRLGCFFVGGWVCGIFWEFFNYWAGARWIYVFPIAQHWKIFQMPAPGLLGFLSFSLEVLVIWRFVVAVAAKFGLSMTAGDDPSV